MLRPGGRLLMVNETLKTLRDPSGMHLEGVEQYEGYEHANRAWRYRWEATRAGFFTEVTEPHYRAFFGDARAHAGAGDAPAAGAAGARASRLQPRRTGPPRLPVVAEQRVGRGLDEHDRHQAHALRRPPRADRGRRRAHARTLAAALRLPRAIGARASPPERPPRTRRAGRALTSGPVSGGDVRLRGSRRRTAPSG